MLDGTVLNNCRMVSWSQGWHYLYWSEFRIVTRWNALVTEYSSDFINPFKPTYLFHIVKVHSHDYLKIISDRIRHCTSWNAHITEINSKHTPREVISNHCFML
jgi:hypothetical protein